MPPTRHFFVVTYDIPDDRRRLRVARWLERFGTRVQYSVFEMYLSLEEWQQVRARLERWLVPGEDQVRVYRLCAACRQRIEVLGRGQPSPPPATVVVI